MNVKSKENNSNRNYNSFQSRKCNAYGIFLFKGVCCKSLMNATLRVIQYRHYKYHLQQDYFLMSCFFSYNSCLLLIK